MTFLKSNSALRKAGAGGAAVAFAVSKIGLYPIALDLSRSEAGHEQVRSRSEAGLKQTSSDFWARHFFDFCL